MGVEEYPERPSLTQLLQARVIVFWQHAEDGERWRATSHANLHRTRRGVLQVAHAPDDRAKAPSHRRHYEDGHQVRLESVKVEFERVYPPSSGQ
ncbi:MAG UNVERIFIED_CONTAM: hypothetical protein LVT10_23300 [Anaerolineae bacterium]